MIAEVGVTLHIGGSWLYSMRATLFVNYYDDLLKANEARNDAIEKASKKARSKGK